MYSLQELDNIQLVFEALSHRNPFIQMTKQTYSYIYCKFEYMDAILPEPLNCPQWHINPDSSFSSAQLTAHHKMPCIAMVMRSYVLQLRERSQTLVRSAWYKMKFLQVFSEPPFEPHFFLDPLFGDEILSVVVFVV